LAGQSDRDRHEWLACMKQYTHPAIMREHSNRPLSLSNIDHEDMMQWNHMNGQFNDGASVYSARSHRSSASMSSHVSQLSRTSMRSQASSRSHRRARSKLNQNVTPVLDVEKDQQQVLIQSEFQSPMVKCQYSNEFSKLSILTVSKYWTVRMSRRY
jgi:hypothetical protein